MSSKNSRVVTESINSRQTRKHKKMLYQFKVGRCFCSQRASGHSHRRTPRIIYGTCYNYLAEECEEFQTKMECSIGPNCPYAHGIDETRYHPQKYKTQLCRNPKPCKHGKACSFAHDERDLRHLEVIYGVNWRSFFVHPGPIREYNKKNTKRIKVMPPKVQKNAWNVTNMGASSERLSSSRRPSVSSTVESMSLVSTISCFTCPSPALERHEEKESVLTTDFSVWFDEAGIGPVSQREQIKEQFVRSGLDDLKYLLDHLSANEVDLSEELTKDADLGIYVPQIMRKLKEYVEPTNVSEWLERVARLPQKYGELFEVRGVQDLQDFSHLDVEDFLTDAEKQMTLIGHWRRLAFYLRMYMSERTPEGK